jgi:hypothetical protein
MKEFEEIIETKAEYCIYGIFLNKSSSWRPGAAFLSLAISEVLLSIGPFW